MTNSVLLNIDVPDLKRGIAFYEKGLGLRFNRTLFDGSVAEMIHDGAALRLYLMEEPAGTKATPNEDKRDYGRHWTPVHVDFIIDDIDGAVERATAAGAKQEKGVDHYEWGDIATLSDPFGNGFCLLDFHEEGYGADTNTAH